MAALLRQLFELCLLRRGPQDLPYSPPALGAAGAGLVAVQLAFGASQGLPAGGLAGRAVVTLFILFAVVPALLRWRGFGNRAMQTQLALAGSSLLFALAMLPTAVALLPHAQDPNPPPQVLGYALVAIALFFWKLRVEAAVWRQALEIRPGQSYALALALVIVDTLLVMLLVPPVSAAPAS